MEIREANLQDSQYIREIYADYVTHTNITFEYDIPSLDEMKSRIEKTLMSYPYLVAEIDNQIVGYAYASRMRERKAYDWCCELSVYVNQDYHHQGIAKALYTQLIEILKQMNIQTLYACITYPNETSVSFHQKFGFHIVGEFKKCGYKFNEWHDVIWMEKGIGTYENVQEVISYSVLDFEK